MMSHFTGTTKNRWSTLVVVQHNHLRMRKCVYGCMCMFRMMAVQVQQQPSEQRLPVLLTVRHRLIATHVKQQRRLILLSSQMCMDKLLLSTTHRSLHSHCQSLHSQIR